ncbi:unnamed protein product [Heligmosomoides polygyrus]|uniref:N-myc downstream regulated n=1 Tax=Heligmosomoides polygyrus TaxID=6339 RepID=A0A3P8A8D7_HELPZ|nr:unnamed protein product [Heligmosomoides polygyrus]
MGQKMSSIEMRAFPGDDQPLVENTQPDMQEERVDTSYGKVKVSIYGNRSKHPLITFHDLALDSESNFQNFFQFVSIAEFTEKFCIYNINAPGQEVDAPSLPDTYVYPSMDGLAKIVETVVDHFEIKSLIAFGVGVGANVLLRYAGSKYLNYFQLLNQRRLDALILVNCVANTAGWIEWAYQKMNLRYLRGSGMNTFTVDYLMWHHFGRRLDECSPDIVRQYRVYFQHLPNPTNLAMFIESYVNRSPIAISRDGQTGPQLNVPVLQIVGAGSPFVNDTVDVNTKLDPAHTDWIKVSDACGLVLDDRPEVVTESMMLFLQGLGFCEFPHDKRLLMKKIHDIQNGSYSAMLDSVDEC